MTKVGLALGTKFGQIAAKLCLFLINKLAVCLNKADYGFADHFEDTECIEVHQLPMERCSSVESETQNICMIST